MMRVSDIVSRSGAMMRQSDCPGSREIKTFAKTLSRRKLTIKKRFGHYPIPTNGSVKTFCLIYLFQVVHK